MKNSATLDLPTYLDLHLIRNKLVHPYNINYMFDVSSFAVYSLGIVYQANEYPIPAFTSHPDTHFVCVYACIFAFIIITC